MMKLQIEVAPAADVDWAPQVDGCTFQWAWRVRNDKGALISGVCNAKRKEALQRARDAARRLRSLQQFGSEYLGGFPAWRNFQINKKAQLDADNG